MPTTTPNLKDMTITATNNTTTGLLQTIQVLKQDLTKSQEEKDKLANQLSCLISLIKRSWMGDNVATHHVSNIIGMNIPAHYIKKHNSPELLQSPAVMNWERFSLGLLNKEYETQQEELRERQQHYMSYRELYMDEILHSHQEQMAQLSLHKNSNNSLHDVDKQFIKTYKSRNRPPTGKQNKAKRPGKLAEEMVDRVDIGLNHLLYNTNTDQFHNTTTQHKRGSLSEGSQNENMVNGNYDDSDRYSKPNLFNTNDAFSSEAFQKKSRPVSASELREKDKLRARPKSAATGLKSGKVDRPLKYETTRPVSGKPSGKSVVDRRGSSQERQRTTSLPNELLLAQQEKAKADLKARIKSATQRPRDIDTFADEVKNINEMETRFKQSAVDLQKKLGINTGMIY